MEKREDFYNILRLSLEKSDLLNVNTVRTKSYVVNKYLNFISPRDIDTIAFRNLKNEYSNSLECWKRGLQRIYVYLAISRSFRAFFANKVIQLPDYGSFLILGGNHRLRLFHPNSNATWSLLKVGERSTYIDNDIELRSGSVLSYAPKIIDSGICWIKEEFFDGVPLNRLMDSKKIIDIELAVATAHKNELLLATRQKISLKNYRFDITEEIYAIITNGAIITNETIINSITNTFEGLFSLIDKNEVNVSWSHGDLQKANILINGSTFRVIDWEACEIRYIWYDLFVMFGESRRNSNDLEIQFTRFKNGMDLLGIEVKPEELVFCLIEELRFRVNEEFSENYFFCGKSVISLCDNILRWIHE